MWASLSMYYELMISRGGPSIYILWIDDFQRWAHHHYTNSWWFPEVAHLLLNQLMIFRGGPPYTILYELMISRGGLPFILGTIHLRRRQIFTIFDPYPPTIGIPAKCLWRGFLILMYCDLLTIGTWGHPSPLRHADVLNGWSLMYNMSWWFSEAGPLSLYYEFIIFNYFSITLLSINRGGPISEDNFFGCHGTTQ